MNGGHAVRPRTVVSSPHAFSPQSVTSAHDDPDEGRGQEGAGGIAPGEDREVVRSRREAVRFIRRRAGAVLNAPRTPPATPDRLIVVACACFSWRMSDVSPSVSPAACGRRGSSEDEKKDQKDLKDDKDNVL